MSNPLRLLTIAAVIIFGTGSFAGAQTVMVRGAVPGETIEVLLNGTAAGTGTIDGTGVGTATFTVPTGDTARPEMNARLFLDTCGKVRRVHVVEQNQLPPDPQDGCQRSDIGGIYWVRQRSTIVINVANAIPVVLLRQGSYNPSTSGPRRPAPTGLIIFGGGGLAQLPDVFVLPCGTVADCSGDDMSGAFTAGVNYWPFRWFGLEASYMKPSTLSGEGTYTSFTFTETIEVHNVVNLVAKLALPVGPVRLYGQGGGNWHESTSSTVQTLGAESTTFNLDVEGWGWTFGGGIEAWVAPRFALYGEANISKLNGDAKDNSTASFENRMRSYLFGARFKIF
jgi:hypothetical protein